MEVSKRWYTYVVSECPRRIFDLQRNEVDFYKAARNEIACQTGFIPTSVRPSRHNPNDCTKQTLLVAFLEETKIP
jgi:hypothetical protein